MPGFGSLKARPEAKTADGVETRFALVVGVDHYDDPAMPDLSFCSSDAIGIAAVLRARGYDVTELHDGVGAKARPTLADVERELRRLKRRADLDDLVVVYFSCHGKQLGGRPYLYMADTPNDDARVPRRGLAVGKVLTMLRGDARWIALFLDACHMGIGLDPGCHKSANHNLERAGGFALLSGSTTAGITQDTTDGGVFSKVLRAGLAGAAADADGCVRFSRLARYVQDGVEQWRRGDEAALMGSRQTPVLRLEVADLPLFPPHDYRDLSPQPPTKIAAAVFSPRGERLYTACVDGSLQAWDTATLELLIDRQWTSQPIEALALSPDGKLLVDGSNDGQLRVWEASTLIYARNPDQLSIAVRGIAWSDDGAHWAVAADDGVRIFDLDPHGNTLGFRYVAEYGIAALDVKYVDRGLVVSCHADEKVRLWNATSGQCERRWDHPGTAWRVAVAADGSLVAAGGIDPHPTTGEPNAVSIWDRKRDAVLGSLTGHVGGVSALAFSPGRDLLVTASGDGRARIWDVSAPGMPLLREVTVKPTGTSHGAEASCACFAPDGKRLFVGYADGRGRLFGL